jgi:hypothetical protein
MHQQSTTRAGRRRDWRRRAQSAPTRPETNAENRNFTGISWCVSNERPTSAAGSAASVNSGPARLYGRAITERQRKEAACTRARGRRGSSWHRDRARRPVRRGCRGKNGARLGARMRQSTSSIFSFVGFTGAILGGCQNAALWAEGVRGFTYRGKPPFLPARLWNAHW